MTAQFEIPPEAMAEILAAVAKVPDARMTIEEVVLVAAPGLFSVFAERLTSDEAVEVAAREWHGAQCSPRRHFDEIIAAHQTVHRNEARELLEAVAAALVPGREDGTDG